jgi:hypothetical protein
MMGGIGRALAFEGVEGWNKQGEIFAVVEVVDTWRHENRARAARDFRRKLRRPEDGLDR